MALPFVDRYDAGRRLAERLVRYAGRDDVIVLGLPRGGVPVAFEVAEALGAAFDVFLVRKLGVPGYEELAMGAIASGGVRILNEDVIHRLGITAEAIEAVAEEEEEELVRRERLYRGNRPAPEVANRTVILVDDGLATGSTMLAACAALRRKDPAALVVAVPVAAPSSCGAIRPQVTEMVCAYLPEPFQAVGLWYRDFSPTTDAEVRSLLHRASRHDAAASAR